MTIRVFESFAGVGSQRMALRNLGIDHEVVAISDVDEFAVKSYVAIHDSGKTVSKVSDEEMQEYLEERNIPLNDKGVRKILKGKKLKEFYEACVKSNNLGDISKVETQDIPDHDLFTYSFPCQDISVAGKGSGLDEGSDTRSGLLWECQKVIYGKRPKYLLLENVKNLVGKKHKHNFDKWLEWLEKQGYTNYWQVLNAKDYGVPQNRERVFVVSILGHHEPYKFPEPIELELRLKDVLEDQVDEKFYLDDEQTKRLTGNTFNQANLRLQEKDYSDTLLARDYKDPKCVRIGGIFDKDGTKHQAGAVWDKDQLSPTLDTMQGGWRQPSVVVGGEEVIYFYAKDNVLIDSITLENSFNNTLPFEEDYVYVDPYIVEDGDTLIIINESVDQGERIRWKEDIWVSEEVIHDNDYLDDIINKAKPKKEYGRMGRQAVETLNENDVKHSDTINPFNKQVSSRNGVSPTLTTRPEGFKTAILPVSQDLRIRKLTPKACWRLMGFSDDDFHRAEEVNSATQLYKQAGNSIVVDVLEGIFKQLLEE